MGEQRKVELCVTYLFHTASAVLITDDDWEDPEAKKTWIPRSQIGYDGRYGDLKEGEAITIEVPEWLAKRDGLI